MHTTAIATNGDQGTRTGVRTRGKRGEHDIRHIVGIDDPVPVVVIDMTNHECRHDVVIAGMTVLLDHCHSMTGLNVPMMAPPNIPCQRAPNNLRVVPNLQSAPPESKVSPPSQWILGFHVLEQATAEVANPINRTMFKRMLTKAFLFFRLDWGTSCAS